MLKTIIKVEKGNKIIFESNFVAICRRLNISYNATKMKKFPFTYREWTFSKIIIGDIPKNFDSFSKKELAEIMEISNYRSAGKPNRK